MLKDLESSSRHEDHLKKIKKKWMDESKKYKETIEHMKEYQEETYQKKNKELVKRLKKKEQILLTALKNNQKSRMKERQKMFEALMQKEKQSRQNVQNFLIKQEKERQKLQIDNNGKSNYIFILYIINYDFFLIQLNLLLSEIRKRKMKYMKILVKEIKIRK